MFNNFTFNCLKMFSSHLCRLIMATIVMFGFKILKLKMCYVFDETEKIKKHGFFNIWDKWKCIFFVFISNREYLLEMVKKKSSLKEYVCKLVLNCDLWKTFSPVRVILWLVYKVTENNCCLSLFFEFIQAQKRYPTFFDKINFLPAKYPISVAAALIWIKGT